MLILSIILIAIQFNRFEFQTYDLNETSAIRSMPIFQDSSKLSRSILNIGASKSILTKNNPTPKIQYESYKALVGETVRLECPQPNPTWFYRHVSNSADQSSNSNDGAEDLIVTRHGIINADYKYKIMCHLTLKHKVIIINNIDFEEEGLYTCLYTMPTQNTDLSYKPPSLSTYYSNSGANSGDAGFFSNDGTSNPVQYRYVFNVTVYSKLFVKYINFFK
jgi:hypothetical protein